MIPELRSQVVDMIGTGASNAAIRDALGVTVNQVAGVRDRDFPARMTRAEALALPKHRKERFDARISGMLPHNEWTTRAALWRALPARVDIMTVTHSLARLLRSGQAEATGYGRGRKFRRAAAQVTA